MLYLLLLSSSLLQAMDLTNFMEKKDIVNNHILLKLDRKSCCQLRATSNYLKEHIDSYLANLHIQVHTLFGEKENEIARKILLNYYPKILNPALCLAIKNDESSFMTWCFATVPKNKININSIEGCTVNLEKSDSIAKELSDYLKLIHKARMYQHYINSGSRSSMPFGQYYSVPHG